MPKKPSITTLPAYKPPPPYGDNTLDWWLFCTRPHGWGLSLHFISYIARQSFFRVRAVLFGLLIGFYDKLWSMQSGGVIGK